MTEEISATDFERMKKEILESPFDGTLSFSYLRKITTLFSDIAKGHRDSRYVVNGDFVSELMEKQMMKHVTMPISRKDDVFELFTWIMVRNPDLGVTEATASNGEKFNAADMLSIIMENRDKYPCPKYLRHKAFLALSEIQSLEIFKDSHPEKFQQYSDDLYLSEANDPCIRNMFAISPPRNLPL